MSFKQRFGFVGAGIILVAALFVLPRPEPAHSQGTMSFYYRTVARVSVASDGTQSNGSSDAQYTAISADGRYVTFTSGATNLVSGDTNNGFDVFVYDRTTQQTTRVSVPSPGQQATFGVSGQEAISADGRYIAFIGGNDLAPNCGSFGNIYIHDQQTGTTTCLPPLVFGIQPSLSADGRYVAFVSASGEIVVDDTNGDYDVFVHDRTTGQTTRVSVASDGTQGNDGSGDTNRPTALSTDGRYVAFSSFASNLVSGDTNNAADVFVHDRGTGQTTRVSVASNGAQSNSGEASSSPTISADGRYVVFHSHSTTFAVGHAPNNADVFIRDRVNGTTELVAVDSNEMPLGGWSTDPAISADGRYVAFTAEISGFVQQIFVRDRVNGVTGIASMSSTDVRGNWESSIPAISADGRFIVFNSWSTNLVPNDTNVQWDVFLAERQEGIAPTATITQTLTRTATFTPSATRTHTPTVTASPSRTSTRTPSATPTPSLTHTPSRTLTRTPTPSPSFTPSATRTFTPTPSATVTPSRTMTLTPSPSATVTRTPTPTATLASTPPPAPVQVAPSGILLTDSLLPTYSWQPVAGAQLYVLTVYDFSTGANIVFSGVSPTACTVTLCSFRPTDPSATLINGRAYAWYVLVYTPAGQSAWSGMAFYIFTPPVAPTLISPSGVIASNVPTYRWQRTPESEWLYYLVVVNVSGQVVFQQILSPATVCTPTECQFTQPTPLADGTYLWYLTAATPAGFGPYAGLPFYVSAGSAPVAPTFVP